MGRGICVSALLILLVSSFLSAGLSSLSELDANKSVVPITGTLDLRTGHEAADAEVKEKLQEAQKELEGYLHWAIGKFKVYIFAISDLLVAACIDGCSFLAIANLDSFSPGPEKNWYVHRHLLFPKACLFVVSVRKQRPCEAERAGRKSVVGCAC